MTDTKTIQRGAPDTKTRAVEAEEAIYVPDVDIWENASQIRLVADMPGVDQNTVDVTVENNVLRIEGRPRLEAPAGYDLVGREYGHGKFHREFALSNAVATDGIKARVHHGVLEVTIPKRDEHKTRKIAITN